MISHLQGNIIFRGSDFVILDVNGVGYKVFLSEKTFSKLSKDTSFAKFYTFLHWREDTMELYGFLTVPELELFETLNNISGIGPRTALQLASFGSLEQLKKELEEGRVAIKGIGRKKLQKIMLEITGKIKEISKADVDLAKEDEALETLIALGIPKSRAVLALKQVPYEITDVQQRIKEALKIAGRI